MSNIKRLAPLFLLILQSNVQASKLKEERRVLQFPNVAIGSLHSMPARTGRDAPWMMYGFGNQIAGAKGTVTLNLAPGERVLLDANRRVFENPLVLKQISGEGIDVLRLGFIPLEDREDTYLGRAISMVDNLKNLHALYLDRSDANDADVSKLKSMKHLQAINLFLSRIDGSCFKGLSIFPALEEVDAPQCHLNPKYIADLTSVSKLKWLDLSRSNMTLAGARALPKLTTVVRLELQGNAQFDDECLKFVAQMPNLTWLDLRGTKVSFDGAKVLRATKLKTVLLPQRFGPRTKDLATLLPGVCTAVDSPLPAVSREDRRIYAPLR